MKIIRLSILPILFTLFSCAGSNISQFGSNYPLTTKIAESVKKDLSVKIPEGWFQSSDNVNNNYELLLIKEDFRCSISLHSLNFASNFPESEDKNQLLKNAVNYSKKFNKVRYGDKFNVDNEESLFKYENKICSSYIFSFRENSTTRVVVCVFKGNVYEFTAVNFDINTVSNLELFNAQNSLINSAL